MEEKLKRMEFLNLHRLEKKFLLFEDTTNLSIEVNWEECISPAQVHKEIQYLKSNYKRCSDQSNAYVIHGPFVSDYNSVGVALLNAEPLTNLNPLLVSTEKSENVLKISIMLPDDDIVHLKLLNKYLSLCYKKQLFDKDVGNNMRNVNSVIERSQTGARTWNSPSNEAYVLKNQPSLFDISKMHTLLLNLMYIIILKELLEQRGK